MTRVPPTLAMLALALRPPSCPLPLVVVCMLDATREADRLAREEAEQEAEDERKVAAGEELTFAEVRCTVGIALECHGGGGFAAHLRTSSDPLRRRPQPVPRCPCVGG